MNRPKMPSIAEIGERNRSTSYLEPSQTVNYQAYGDTSPEHHTSEPSNPSEPSDVSTLPPSDLADRIHAILSKYIGADDDDLKMLSIWCLHTWVLPQLRFTPRLLIDSPVYGAGKSTLLAWLKKFSHDAALTSSITSVPLLVRMADAGNTLLVDEADRSLDKDNPLTKDFLSIVNQGYKDIDSERPTLEKDSNGNWRKVSYKTFCAAAFAGNSPNLPPDTQSRCITVFLYPSDDVEESDWELIDENEKDVKQLPKDIAEWAERYTDAVKTRPDMPEQVKGRAREIWLPLARVAQTMRGDYLDVIRSMAEKATEQARIDAEEGMSSSTPHIQLVKDIARIWATQWASETAVQSSRICTALALNDPENWGPQSSYGSKITGKRLAMMLRKVGVHASRYMDDGKQVRGYTYKSFAKAWKTFHVWEALKKDGVTEPGKDGTQPELDTLDMSDTLDGSYV